jgi:hypothetical protein
MGLTGAIERAQVGDQVIQGFRISGGLDSNITNSSLTVAGAVTTTDRGLAAAKRAAFDFATATGDQTVVAGVGGKKLRVHGYFLSTSAAITIRWRSAAGGSWISGSLPLLASTLVTVPYAVSGWFETVAAEALILNLSALSNCGGVVVYEEV